MRKRALITGGTGFFGRRLGLALHASHDVFLGGRRIQQTACAGMSTGCTEIAFDITDIESVRAAIASCQPDIVIHAAAYKHVQRAESEPQECIDANVLGSQNVARVCMEQGVATVIGISSEKAAPPVRGTYGLTKALMERLHCSLNGQSATKFTTVRFGNLAWSPGSVLTIWKKMHEKNGVIGTTGPEMRRFFLAVDDAVEQIQNASAHIDALAGKVVVRQTKGVQISDMLDVFVREYGGRWEKIAGAWAGEAEDELLIGERELPFACAHEFGGVTYYALDFAHLSSQPILQQLSTATMPRMSDTEIVQMIGNQPDLDGTTTPHHQTQTMAN